MAVIVKTVLVLEHRPRGAPVPREYSWSSDLVIRIDDAVRQLFIEVEPDETFIQTYGKANSDPPAETAAKAPDEQFQLKAPKQRKADGTWIRADLRQFLTRHRRYGHRRFRYPCGFELPLYVEPTEVFDSDDVANMVREIEQSTGVNVSWSSATPNDADTVASAESADRLQATTSEIVMRVLEEIPLAASLTMVPFTELAAWQPGIGPQIAHRRAQPMPSPEMTVVPLWAGLRSRQLHRVVHRLERASADFRARTVAQPKARADQHMSIAGELDELASQCRDLRQRLAPWLQAEAAPTLPVFTSLMQRDHRLRRLATTIGRREALLPVPEVHRPRQMPFVDLNRLFECWAACWLVGALEAAGFECIEADIEPERFEHGRWVLARDEVRAILDYEPGPRVLPSLDVKTSPVERGSTAEAARVAAASPPLLGQYYATTEKASPDYTLRFEGTDETVLLIGDAVLATPDDHRALMRLKADPKMIFKPTKVDHYRRTVRWRADERTIVRCSELGAFVVYPGPQAPWTKNPSQHHLATRHPTPETVADVSLITPHPKDDGAALVWFHRLLRLNGVDVIPDFSEAWTSRRPSATSGSDTRHGSRRGRP